MAYIITSKSGIVDSFFVLASPLTVIPKALHAAATIPNKKYLVTSA